jgi:hypothetical protein
LAANNHDLINVQDEIYECNQAPSAESSPDHEEGTRLINAARTTFIKTVPPGDVRRVMSKSSKQSVNIMVMEYKVSFRKSAHG